jgi:hypothetical protein
MFDPMKCRKNLQVLNVLGDNVCPEFYNSKNSWGSGAELEYVWLKNLGKVLGG